MKSIAQLVLEFIDNAPLGEIISRQGLINYVCETNKHVNKTNFSTRSTIDCYKRILQINNIISEPIGKLGEYVNINEVPKNVTMNELKERCKWPINPYYSNKVTGAFTLAQDLLGDL